MRILYFDCFSGISGDMTIAALVDAGADRQYMERELSKINLEPYKLEWKSVTKCGVTGLKFDVVLDPLHSPVHHRHYTDIIDVIRNAGFNEKVTAISLGIFKKIGEAEAKIHNIPLKKVHFHEVGAVDSIIDVIGTALALDSLNIDKIISAPVPLGSGIVECDHGLYPIPAPATLEMMKGVPVATTQHNVELTTPTGAGIIAALANDYSRSLPPMFIEAIGYGAGTRDLPQQPNMLRVVVGSTDKAALQWQPPHRHTHEEQTVAGHHHDHHHDHSHRQRT